MGIVQSVCERLKLFNSEKQLEIPDLYAQILSLYVLYGRPFKQRSLYRLSYDIVQPTLKPIHTSVIRFRDKMFAHIDSDASAIRSDEGELLAKMIVLLTEDSTFCTMSAIVPREVAFEEFSALTKAVRKSCQQNLQRIWGRYPNLHDTLEVGQYEINIEDLGDAPILKKVLRE